MNVRTIGQDRATLAGEVRRELERMIVHGELAAGEKMNELALAQAMGVSRGTVREAIRSLADSGLIDLIANRGAFVHETTLEEVRNLYDLRGAIFAMACAAAARRAGEGSAGKVSGVPVIDALRDNIGKMRAAVAEDNRAQYYELNIEFHELLMLGSENPRAKTIYDNLVKEMHLFRRRGLSVPTNMARSLDEHEAIAQAVAAGDPEQARMAAQAHIVAGLARYMTTVEREA